MAFGGGTFGGFGSSNNQNSGGFGGGGFGTNNNASSGRLPCSCWLLGCCAGSFVNPYQGFGSANTGSGFGQPAQNANAGGSMFGAANNNAAGGFGAATGKTLADPSRADMGC